MRRALATLAALVAFAFAVDASFASMGFHGSPPSIAIVISGVSSGTPSSSGATITATFSQTAIGQVCWGTYTSPQTYPTCNAPVAATTSFSSTISGLIQGTTYYFQITANAAGYLQGTATGTFNTAAGTLLSVGTSPPSLYTISSGVYQLAWAPTTNPGYQGSACVSHSPLGCDDNVIANWTSVPYQLQTSGNITHCVLAHHASGIQYVSMAIDGATFGNVTTATGPSGETEYCGTAAASSFTTDGMHEWRAIVCPNTGWCRVLQNAAVVTVANTGTGGVALITHQAHGQFFNKRVWVLVSADANLPATMTPYCISSKNNGSADFNANQYELATTCGSSGTPITLASSPATLTVAWAGAPFGESIVNYHVEQGASQGGSFYENTNAQGTITAQSVYIDAINGTDGSACNTARGGATTTPCQTMSGALTAMTPTNGPTTGTASQSLAAVTGLGVSHNCIGFTATGNVTGAKPYLVGEPVRYTATTAAGGLITKFPYFVWSTHTTDSTLGADQITIATSPNAASCIAYSTNGTGTQTLAADYSYSNIELECGSPCSSPTPYTLGTETVPQAASLGWLNIVPYGTTTANVPIQIVTTDGIYVDRQHIATDLLSETAQVTVTTDSPCGTQVTNPPTNPPNCTTSTLYASSIPSWITTELAASRPVYLMQNSSGCSYTSNAASTIVTVATASAGTITLTPATSQTADCPVGTVLTFANFPQLKAGQALWLDAPLVSLAGADLYGLSLFLQSSWVQDDNYFTNGTYENLYSGAPNGALVSGLTVGVSATAGSGGCFNSTVMIINSSCQYIGSDQTTNVGNTLSANAGTNPNTGTSTLTYTTQLSSIPGNPYYVAPGMTAASYGCNLGSSYLVNSVDYVGNVLTLNKSGAGCVSGNTQQFGNLFHPDFTFLGQEDVLTSPTSIVDTTNAMFENVTCVTNCSAEGIFVKFVPMFDQSFAYVTINISNLYGQGYGSIDFQAPSSTNTYFYKDTISGGRMGTYTLLPKLTDTIFDTVTWGALSLQPSINGTFSTSSTYVNMQFVNNDCTHATNASTGTPTTVEATWVAGGSPSGVTGTSGYCGF